MKKQYLAMVVYTQFSTDARVQRAAKAAVEAGFAVEVFTLNEDHEFSLEGVTIIRSSQKQRRAGVLSYLLLYLHFFFFCFFTVSWRYLSRRYTICHIHNMPNFLVFTCLLPKIGGAKLILDLHDLMPEQYSYKFQKPKDHWMIRVLYWEQRVSANFCDELISVDFRLVEKFKRDGLRKPMTIVLNVPEKSIYALVSEKNYAAAALKIVFASSLHSSVTGIDYLLEAAQELKKQTSAFEIHVYGKGEYLPIARQRAEKFGLGSMVHFSDRWLSAEELALEYQNAHIGVVAVGNNVATEYGIPMKMFEYFAMKLAVVMSDVPSNMGMFSPYGMAFRSDDSKDLAQKLLTLINDRILLQEYSLKGFAFQLQHTWQTYKNAYIELLARLSPAR